MLVLVFYLGETQYVIKHDKVREVSPMVNLKRLPHAPAYFSGFFNYRGHLVPVVDLRQLIQGEPSRMRLSTRIILFNSPNRDGHDTVFGLIAERVTEAVRKPDAAFICSNINLEKVPYLKEFVLEKGEMVHCIDLAALGEQLRQLHVLQVDAEDRRS